MIKRTTRRVPLREPSQARTHLDGTLGKLVVDGVMPDTLLCNRDEQVDDDERMRRACCIGRMEISPPNVLPPDPGRTDVNLTSGDVTVTSCVDQG